MGEKITIDELRAAALTVKRFLHNEIRIRQRLQVSQPWKRRQWRQKEEQAVDVTMAYERLLAYIASTDPTAWLESAPQQQLLFMKVEEDDQEYGVSGRRSSDHAGLVRPAIGSILAEETERSYADTSA